MFFAIHVTSWTPIAKFPFRTRIDITLHFRVRFQFIITQLLIFLSKFISTIIYEIFRAAVTTFRTCRPIASHPFKCERLIVIIYRIIIDIVMIAWFVVQFMACRHFAYSGGIVRFWRLFTVHIIHNSLIVLSSAAVSLHFNATATSDRTFSPWFRRPFDARLLVAWFFIWWPLMNIARHVAVNTAAYTTMGRRLPVAATTGNGTLKHLPINFNLTFFMSFFNYRRILRHPNGTSVGVAYLFCNFFIVVTMWIINTCIIVNAMGSSMLDAAPTSFRTLQHKETQRGKSFFLKLLKDWIHLK